MRTVVYGYGDANWKDKMTSYDGQTITYDAIGNPLEYRDGMEFTWQNGRELAALHTPDGDASYTYNADGIRTRKQAGGQTTEYLLEGSRVIAESTGGDVIWYYYDSDGVRAAMEYEGDSYYYVYNLQGDVLALVDEIGEVVVEYTYDSWGNILSVTGSMASTLGVDNPFRYRGYYYDEESGLYYLNSRYYDPVTGRFINADKYISTGLGVIRTNMYSYCENNPINYWDPTGCFFKEIGDFFKGIGSAVKNFLNDFANDYRAPALALGAGDLPYTGKPGSHVTSPDGTKERIYGPDGKPDRDRHHTDHGNPKQHPVPHDHDWEEKPNGNWEPGKPYPSPDGPLQPRNPAITLDPEIEFNFPDLSWLNPPTGDNSFSGHVRDFFDSFVIDYTK